MKRIIALVLVLATVLTIVFALASCGSTVECSLCGEEFNSNDGEKIAEVEGEAVWLCPDCKALKDAFGGMID